MKLQLFLSRTTVAFLIAVAASAAASSNVFGADYSDVRPGNWAYGAVSALSEKGIVNGYPDGSFLPSGTVTYGEFIKMACIAQGGEALAASGSDWALPYYEAAVESLLFTEHDIPKAALPRPIPRVHMALILSRILGDVPVEDSDAVLAKLSDVTESTPYAFDIVKATARGLITGYPDRTFRPEATLTRAEAATVIHRLMNDSERRLPDLRPPEEKTPLERLEDVDAEHPAPLHEVLNGSDSKRPISEVLDEPVFSYGNEPILYYEIFEDFPFQMKIGYNLVGQEQIIIDYKGADGLLIKDRKIIAKLHSGTNGEGEGVLSIWNDDKTFPDFDYIAIVPGDGNVLMLIPNNM
jgi:hypothetical protein